MKEGVLDRGCAMKLFTSWITDPCFHVLAVVILLVYVAMLSGSDAPSRDGEDVACQSCERVHGELQTCPMLPAIPPVVHLAAH
jgi:hypothetical protein